MFQTHRRPVIWFLIPYWKIVHNQDSYWENQVPHLVSATMETELLFMPGTILVALHMLSLSIFITVKGKNL